MAPSQRSGDPPDYVVSDITSRVQKALGRFGTPGTVRWTAASLVLVDGQGVESDAVFVGGWASNWALMDEATRNMQAEGVARGFRKQLAKRATRRPPRRPIFIDGRLVLAAFVLLAAGAWIFWGGEDLPEGRTAALSEEDAADLGGETTPRSPQTQQSASGSGDARASRVCANTLTRIFQGGSVSVADVDGFRVEIALLDADGGSRMDTHPALKQFILDPQSATGSPFIWKEQSDLAQVATSDTVVVARRVIVGTGDAALNGLVLSFGGSLVDAYFKEETRSRYFHIAHALTEQLGATHTAVYARCFDRPLHALGAWFRGDDTAAAITSLVYFMGTYARPLHVARPFSRLPGDDELNRFHAFSSIAAQAAPMTRDDLATVLGKEGGMATGRDGEGVIITFPFGDGNRASRASRGLARVSGLGM